MIDEAKLKQWLKKLYQNSDATYRDAIKALYQYQSLKPQQESYTFTDGSVKELVNLSGTIPVTYKGAIYNIPICIWLLNTHPSNAPLCYVKPTADMLVKSSNYVDQNGKVYLPYLMDWTPLKSDLVGLIEVMIMIFGKKPPVFARQNREVRVTHNPPVTSVGAGSPHYQSNASCHTTVSFKPVSVGQMPAVDSTAIFSDYPQYSGSPMQAYPSANNFGSAVPPINTGTIKGEHIKLSLISGIEEKLLRKINEQLQQKQAELQTLTRIQQELKQGRMQLDSVLNRLEKQQSDLEKSIIVLKDTEQELKTAIEKMENEEPINVDDAVVTTAPLYKQLLNIYAEEAALEDAIYYMGEALRCGVIDLDVFLKQVRSLTRKQFMLRALMQKCRQKAGLLI